MTEQRHEGGPEDRVARNIATIASIEQSQTARRPVADRLSDVIANFSGSIRFVAIHIVWFVLWIAVNRRGGGKPFDPYPYNLLTLVVSLEAIFLSTFVLISQNHMTRLAERRAHLDLQINLLSEAEMTKVLKTLEAIATHLGMPADTDEEIRDLAQPTNIKRVAEAVARQMDPPK